MQRIHNTDDSIESQIQAKGKTAARVTPSDIEAAIKTVIYFTAAEGSFGAVALPIKKQGGNFSMEDENDGRLAPLDLLTFCVLVLRNGFTVTGESACASPENFDAEIVQKIAYDNAKQKLWPLLGYELKSKLASA